MSGYSDLPFKELDLFITSKGFYLSQPDSNVVINNNDIETNKEELDIKSSVEDLSIKESILNSTNLKTENKATTVNSKRPSLIIKVENQAITLENLSLPNTPISGPSITSSQGIFSLPKNLPKFSIENIKKKYLFLSFFEEEKINFVDELDKSLPFKKYRIYGIIGNIKLLTGWHLVVIIKNKLAGKVNNCSIYHIEKISLLPYDYTLSVLAIEEDLIYRKELIDDDDDNNKDDDDNNKDDDDNSKTNLFDRLKAVVQSNDDVITSRPTSSLSNIDSTKVNLNNLKVDTEIARSLSTISPTNSPKFQSDFGIDLNGSNTSSSISNEFNNIKNHNHLRKTSLTEDELLEDRVKKEILKLFSNYGNMYYSYERDLTNSIQYNDNKNNQQFFWNKEMLKDFLNDEKFNKYIIPVIQGYVQTEQCEVDGIKFDLTLISRRSVYRLGMRYQRRGVNELGYVANFAETEQIIEYVRDDQHHLCSLLQIRGSIPLFWSQSPYSLKPIPIMERSGLENLDAIIKHLYHLKKWYGDFQFYVNLAEQSGRENIVSSAYRSYLNSSKEKLGKVADKVQLIEFDFHRETQGMNYSNVSKLIDQMENGLNQIGYYWKELNQDTQFISQSGIVRTNCMDCLDRTNVVQSTLARHSLNLQLFRLGIQEYPDQGVTYHPALEKTFSDIWANNGDALSQSYAGTSALKGDFTRTGKRNLQGLVNDATNSLSRFYINAFQDYFTQAVLDYLQGYHLLERFKEVAETHIATEPGLENRLLKVRSNAVESSASIVLLDIEYLLSGWTLLSPLKLDKIYSSKLEEKVLLLTNLSIYICSYHYGLEKVIQFIRIPIDKLQSIQIGQYYLTLSDLKSVESPTNGLLPTATQNNNNHFGLIINYLWDDILDLNNTRSLRQPTTRLLQLMVGTKLSNLDQNEKIKKVYFKMIPNLEFKPNENNNHQIHHTISKFISDQPIQSNNNNNSSIFSNYDLTLHVANLIKAVYQAYHHEQSNSTEQNLNIIEQTILSPDQLRKKLFNTNKFFI